MSNRAAVQELEAGFRRQAKLLKGYFRFVLKETLAKAESLDETLSVLPLAAGFRHTLHDFIDSLERRAKTLTATFMADIRELGLEDYAQLRQLSLNREGHPFGDYILRMFGAYLVSLVLEDADVMRQASALDDTKFEALLPLHDEPSAVLGKIYLASLTEKVRSPVAGHGPPLAAPVPTFPPEGGGGTPEDIAGAAPPAEVSPGEKPPAPLLPIEFGDLFVKSSDMHVYAVMNPACDLVLGASRNREPSDTVLLLPGHLRQLHESFRGKRAPSLFTPLYLDGDRVYRIDWDYRKLVAVPHDTLSRPDGNAAGVLEGYVRDRRLHLGPALELQQHFTSATSRVGLAVPPPIGRAIDLTVHCRGSDGKWMQLGAVVTGGCVVYHMRDRDQFVVVGPARGHITALVTSHLTTLEAATGSWENPGTRAQYLKGLRQAATKWRTEFPFYRTPGSLPGGRVSEKGRNTKPCETKDRLSIAIGTSVLASGKVDDDVVLCLDLKPMVFPFPNEDLPREMETS